MKLARLLFAGLVVLALSACAGGNAMVKSQAPVTVSADKATIVFMRPSNFGFAISSAVYDNTAAQPQFIGLVEANTKVAYVVEPGEHSFMVVSEAADFLKATVDAGKTYYVLVTPRMGAWRARFSFRPLRHDELSGAEFAGWDKETTLTENSAKTLAWSADNMPSVLEKRAKYWPEWNAKEQVQRDSQTLRAEDGR